MDASIRHWGQRCAIEHVLSAIQARKRSLEAHCAGRRGADKVLLFEAAKRRCGVGDPNLRPFLGETVEIEQAEALIAGAAVPFFGNCAAVELFLNDVQTVVFARNHIPFPDPEIQEMELRRLVATRRLRCGRAGIQAWCAGNRARKYSTL